MEKIELENYLAEVAGFTVIGRQLKINLAGRDFTLAREDWAPFEQVGQSIQVLDAYLDNINKQGEFVKCIIDYYGKKQKHIVTIEVIQSPEINVKTEGRLADSICRAVLKAKELDNGK